MNIDLVALEASRRCRQCNRRLKDPVSIDEGMGFICAGRVNAIAAQFKHADPNGVDFDAIKKVATTLPDVAKVKTKWAKIADLFAHNTEESLRGQDLRWLVNDIAYILSYPLPADTTKTLPEMISALGYDQLARLIMGELCTTGGKFYFDNVSGLICIEGKASTTAAEELRKVGAGSTSAHARLARKFVEVCRRFWLNVSNEEDAIAQADAWLQGHPTILVQRVGRDLAVMAPYNQKFVAAIKTLPRSERRFDAEFVPSTVLPGFSRPGAWMVAPSMISVVKRLITVFYPGETARYPEGA